MPPLNLGQTLDAGIRIVRAQWRTLALVMLVVALPIQLLDIVIIRSTTDAYDVGTSSLLGDTPASRTAYGNKDAFVAGQFAIQLLGALGYVLGTVACYRAIVDAHLGRPSGARASLRFARGRLGAGLLLGLLFLAVVVPTSVVGVGVWLAVAWSVAFPAMLVEGPGGFAALRRSFDLVRGRWWATLGRLLVAYLLAMVATGAATFALLLPAYVLVDETSFAALLLHQTANLAASLLTTPFIAAVTTLVYFDLRARKEGFDPAVLAGDGAGGSPPGGPDPAASFRGWAPPVAPDPLPPRTY